MFCDRYINILEAVKLRLKLYFFWQAKFQRFFFKFVTNQKFEIAIMCIIAVNMIGMGAEYHGQPQSMNNALEYINQLFIAIFTLEAILKLMALRWYYFKEPWNVFDFGVCLVSIAGW